MKFSKYFFIFLFFMCLIVQAQIKVNLFNKVFYITPELEDEIVFYLQKEIGKKIDIKEIKFGYSKILLINNEYESNNFKKNVDFIKLLLEDGLYVEKKDLKNRFNYYEPGEDISPKEAENKIEKLRRTIGYFEDKIKEKNEEINEWNAKMDTGGSINNIYYEYKISKCLDLITEYEYEIQEIYYAISYYENFRL